MLTKIGRHFIQWDPDGAVWRWVIRVEGQELLAQQTQTLLLPARLFVGIVLFLHGFELDQQIKVQIDKWFWVILAYTLSHISVQSLKLLITNNFITNLWGIQAPAAILHTISLNLLGIIEWLRLCIWKLSILRFQLLLWVKWGGKVFTPWTFKIVEILAPLWDQFFK